MGISGENADYQSVKESPANTRPPNQAAQFNSLARKFSVFTTTLVFWVVLSTLVYDFSKETFDLAKSAILCAVVFAVSVLISRFTLRILVRPLSILQMAMKSVRQGKLETIQVSPTHDEIEYLGRSFNQMIAALAESREEVRQHQILLEERIKQRTEALEEAVSKANVASQAKSAFLANISHELRTPMSGVLGMIDIVLDSRLTPEQREQLETAQRCAHSLLALLNDILDLSKIEAGKMSLERIPFDIHSLLQDCVKSHAPKARQKGIGLVSEFGPGLPKQVMGDPLRVRQILANLLSNAVKFTERGMVKTVVQVQPLAEPGRVEVEISVSDTGVGIPPEKLAAIFEKFTQADGTVSRRYGGTGLGLTITKMLAGLQNGNVWVESEVGRGSTFHVTLQFETSNVAVPEQEQPAGVVQPEPVGGHGDREAPKILVVEDNLVNQKVIATILRKKGFRVRIASHGGEALEALGSEEFALILMDVQMPVLDGLETTRLIRRDPKWVHIPILAMTAHALNGDREKCLQAGMDSYISKPVNPGHLISSIQAHLATGSRRASALMVHDERPAPIDQDLADRLLDHSPQLMKSMVALFLELAPERVQKLQTAARHNDSRTLRESAEELKKAAERIAATGIAACAGEIERTAAVGDPESAGAQLHRLEAEITRLHTHAQP